MSYTDEFGSRHSKGTCDISCGGCECECHPEDEEGLGQAFEGMVLDHLMRPPKEYPTAE